MTAPEPNLPRGGGPRAAIAALASLAGLVGLVGLAGLAGLAAGCAGEGAPPGAPGADRPPWLDAPRSTLTDAGVGLDGIRTLDAPEHLSVAEVLAWSEARRGKLLVSSDRVLGVEVLGEARAYPLRILNWHEIVNDRLGGRPISVWFHPLSFAAAAYERPSAPGDDRPAAFGVSGVLASSIAAPYLRSETTDPGSGPLWHPLTGAPIEETDPGSAARLTPVPCSLTTWGAWSAEHPDTTVLAPDPRYLKLYPRDPYGPYYASRRTRFPVPETSATPLDPWTVYARIEPADGGPPVTLPLGTLAPAPGAGPAPVTDLPRGVAVHRVGAGPDRLELGEEVRWARYALGWAWNASDAAARGGSP